MSTNIPCVLMRGGTSRGPFFLADWLPRDPEAVSYTHLTLPTIYSV